MGKLNISLACCDYDRCRALFDGRVQIEGCEVAATALEPEEAFHRAFKFQEFDVSELSLSSYTNTLAKGGISFPDRFQAKTALRFCDGFGFLKAAGDKVGSAALNAESLAAAAARAAAAPPARIFSWVPRRPTSASTRRSCKIPPCSRLQAALLPGATIVWLRRFRSWATNPSTRSEARLWAMDTTASLGVWEKASLR